MAFNEPYAYTGGTQIVGDVRSLPLFTPSSQHPLPKSTPSPDEKFCMNKPGTNVVVAKHAGFLPAQLDNLDDEEDSNRNPTPCRKVLVASEVDITSRVSSKVPLYTTALYVGYPDGSIAPGFVFSEAIVEYRPNIGSPSKRVIGEIGKAAIYMGTYASVGIPLSRYLWIVDWLESYNDAGLAFIGEHDEKIKIENGYAWVVATLTDTQPPMATVTSKDQLSRTVQSSIKLIELLKTTKRSIKGNVVMSLTLKRAVVGSTCKRKLGFNLKYVQPIDVTDISGPTLDQQLAFVAADVQSSNTIMDAFNAIRQRSDQANNPSATDRPQPSGTSTMTVSGPGASSSSITAGNTTAVNP
jgi:hypothetical protein